MSRSPKLDNAVSQFRQARDRQSRAATMEDWLLDQHSMGRAEEAIRGLSRAGEIDAGDLPPDLGHLCEPQHPQPPVDMRRAMSREIPAP